MPHTEGDANTTRARAAWSTQTRDPATQALLDRDAQAFLHQSLSSPCLSTIAKADGIWIEDTAGRRFMDFHGNSVHHIGYGHPRLVAAIKDQMDRLPFSPRRYTNDVAVALAEKLAQIRARCSGQGAVHHRRVGRQRSRAQDRPRRHRPLQDAQLLGQFPRCRVRRISSVGGEATFRSHIAGPLLPGTEHVAPYHPTDCPYGTSTLAASAAACAKMIDYVLGRDGDYAAFIAEPMRAVPIVPPPGFWQAVRAACDRHSLGSSFKCNT